MNKKILLSIIVTAFTFSGCLSTKDVKPTVQSAKEVKKSAENKANSIADKADKAEKKLDEVITTEEVVTPPEESTLKDKAVEKAVDVADKHTNGKASQIIESVQQ